MQYGDVIDVADWFAAFCHVYGRLIAKAGDSAETYEPEVLRKASKRRARVSKKVFKVLLPLLVSNPHA